LVTEGRRSEFKSFAAFSSPNARALIPDPQDEATFARSRLRWEERECEPHLYVLALVRELLDVRRRARAQSHCEVSAAGPAAVVLRYTEYLVAVQLEGLGTVDLSPHTGGHTWAIELDTERPDLTRQPLATTVEGAGSALTAGFQRPGALVLRKLAPSVQS
jgi:hypothetical protein